MHSNIKTLAGSNATLILRDSRSTRLDVMLVGLYKEKYLLASFSGQEDSLKHAKANRRYLVQVKKENIIHMFNASLVKIETGSFPMVHLSLGQDVINTKRRSPRVIGESSKIRLSMKRGEGMLDVSMADISVAGARLVANQRLGNIGDAFTIDMKSLYSDAHFNVRCKIRHLRTEVDRKPLSRIVFHHGVEFADVDIEAKNFLEQFVKETFH